MTSRSANELTAESPRGNPSDQLRQAVWEILREECGAADEQPPDFVQWPACREYRFMGALGFGGKVWWSPHYYPDAFPSFFVNYYPENQTPERDGMVAAANSRLANLRVEGSPNKCKSGPEGNGGTDVRH